jgi:electron transfer flavoprotein beta subunit
MKAKKKPIEEMTADQLGVDLAPRLEILKTSEPSGRSAGVKVASAAELVGKLAEAGVL